MLHEGTGIVYSVIIKWQNTMYGIAGHFCDGVTIAFSINFYDDKNLQDTDDFTII